MRISDWSSDVCSSDLGDARTESISPTNSRFWVILKASTLSWARSTIMTGLTVPRVTGLRLFSQRQRPRPMSRPIMTIETLPFRSEEHTSELQSLMRISYAVFCLKKKKNKNQLKDHTHNLQDDRDTHQNQ